MSSDFVTGNCTGYIFNILRETALGLVNVNTHTQNRIIKFSFFCLNGCTC